MLSCLTSTSAQVANACKEKGADAAEVMLCDLSFTERVDKLCKQIMSQHPQGINVRPCQASSFMALQVRRAQVTMPSALCPGYRARCLHNLWLSTCEGSCMACRSW